MDTESLDDDRYPQQQALDRDTVRRWRGEAITASARDRLWLNRCEALCNALLDKQAELAVAYGGGRSPEETEWFSALDRAKEENTRLRYALEWYIASGYAQVVLKGD